MEGDDNRFMILKDEKQVVCVECELLRFEQLCVKRFGFEF